MALPAPSASFADRVRAAWRALSYAPQVRNAVDEAVYESGSTGTRRTQHWSAPNVSPNTAILYNLETLRNRSRTATRNNGYAKGAIDKLVSNIIGTGIKPLSKAADPAFRKAVHVLWTRWTDESDADGLLDLYGQQAQVTRSWLEGGEIFIRLRPRLPADGLSVPLQLQVVEPELCPHTYDATLPSGNKVRAGIEFNRVGKRVAYWFHPSRAGDLDDFDDARLVRVPADRVVHLFDPLRPGQLRGLPHLTQALIRLQELDKFDDAVLLRQQIANLFAGFIKKQPEVGTESVHPLTGLAETNVDDEDRPIVSMEPGTMQELALGEEVEFSKPPDAGQTYVDFVRQQLFHISAATGVPYEVLTGDLSKVNDRTVRVILNDFRRRLQGWQHQIIAFQFCRPVWNAWLLQAFLSNALPLPANYQRQGDRWTAVSWMPQRWPYLHPVQDVEAEQAAIRAGFTSRSATVSEHGEDVEEIDAQQAADNARADELALKFDSDGRNAKNGAPAAVDSDNPPVSAQLRHGVIELKPEIHVDARTTIAEGAMQPKFVETETHEHHHAAAIPVETIVEKTLVRNQDGRADGVVERHIPVSKKE